MIMILHLAPKSVVNGPSKKNIRLALNIKIAGMQRCILEDGAIHSTDYSFHLKVYSIDSIAIG